MPIFSVLWHIQEVASSLQCMSCFLSICCSRLLFAASLVPPFWQVTSLKNDVHHAHNHIPSHPITSHNIHYEVLLDVKGCYGTLWDIMECYGTLSDVTGCDLTLWDVMGCYETLWDVMGCDGM